jgi:hypothetical protein
MSLQQAEDYNSKGTKMEGKKDIYYSSFRENQIYPLP